MKSMYSVVHAACFCMFLNFSHFFWEGGGGMRGKMGAECEYDKNRNWRGGGGWRL